MHFQLIPLKLYRTKSSSLSLFILKWLSDETLSPSPLEFSDEIIPLTPVKFRKRPHCESDTDTDLPVPRRAPHPYKVFYFM